MRCLEEKVLTSVADANIGSIFGWGFAPFKGGTLQYINDYGVRAFVERCHELTGNLKGQLSVDLGHPYRLLFVPADDPIPYRKEGGLDWQQVTEIEITDITDTH